MKGDGFLAAVADTVTFPESDARIPVNLQGETSCVMIIRYKNGRTFTYTGECWEKLDFGAGENRIKHLSGYPRSHAIDELAGSEPKYTKHQ